MRARPRRALVAGAGGFIGGYLVGELHARGFAVRAVDVKPVSDWFQVSPEADNRTADLSGLSACQEAVADVDLVFNLACDMGGMGFIEAHKADCMLSVLINTHLLLAAQQSGVARYFFASSACVYAAEKQTGAAVTALREQDAYPAMPEDGYGWEKLFGERMCRHFEEDYGIQTRVARFHNVYGPYGAYDGGREKAPAALCRKVAHAALTGRHEIEIWGDGEQTRSFTYIDDAITGTLLVATGDSSAPVNVGSSELVSINQLVTTIERIAGITVERHHRLDAPLGVRGRNSDNTMIRSTYGWEPSVPLAQGLEQTYRWVHQQLSQAHAGAAAAPPAAPGPLTLVRDRSARRRRRGDDPRGVAI